jgi:hypothetical protein
LYADVSPSHLLLIIAFSTHLTIEQTVASRVAEEVGVKLGEEVGYTIRFEDQTNPVQSSFTPYTSFKHAKLILVPKQSTQICHFSCPIKY